MVPKLDRLARSVPDARGIADELMKRGVKLQPGSTVHDPTDPMGKAKGKLKGKQPKLSPKQRWELRRMYDTGDYSISDLSDVFKKSRPTIYRPLARQQSASGPSTKRKPAKHG